MIIVNDFKPGNTFYYENGIYLVMDIQHNKTAMRQMIVKVKAKNLRTGATTDISFTGGDKVELAVMNKKKMSYLYDEGTSICFMDNETFEQISIDKSRLEWEMNFLKEGTEVEIIDHEGEIMGINLPAKVVLQITECEPAVRGDTVNKAMKDAITETGLKVRVPLFVEQGESIWVFTVDGKYDSRA